MSLGVVATVFALVALAELPDKTMIATLVMGSRSRPVLVWAGACGAFLIHVAVAVGAGRLVELLPHRVLEIVVTVLFAAGAAYLLCVPERAEEAKGEAEAEAGDEGVAGGGTAGARAGARATGAGGDPGARRIPVAARVAALLRRVAAGGGAMGAGVTGAASPRRVVATAFGVILVGELGDLTQLLTINLVARYHQPWSVFVGAYAGLVAASAAGAFGGRALIRWLPLEWIRRGGGVALLGFAAYGIYSLVA